MIVRDERNRELIFDSSEFLFVLNSIVAVRERDVTELKNKINKYEEKRRAEDAFYQSLSPVRKFFTGRAPSHHQAVEYMVYVKERLKQVDGMNRRIAEIKFVMNRCTEQSGTEVFSIPSVVMEEVISYQQMEV